MPKNTHKDRPPANLIVGLGASAGGLDAFRSFFADMPCNTGMAFVLIQHLDPTFQSSLALILESFTAMPVHVATQDALVAPDHVYVIPPDTILTIADGKLQLSPPASVAARRASINSFLTSLAQDQGDKAVGIILSGFGSDGALGIAAIKEHGGLTLSQADFDHHAQRGMPQSAASGGFVDYVLPVADMPAALIEYQRRRTSNGDLGSPDQTLADHVATICGVLHSLVGRDFSQYKRGTLTRRIQRRMHVLQIDDVLAYINLLRTSRSEAELLFRELLIGVTRFFRNPESFAALGTTVLSGLMAGARDAGPIRVWVPGCATGEEAYSIAILLKDGLMRAESRRPVQTFATDVDDHAIEIARAGIYPETIEVDVPAEHLERYFVAEQGAYRVTKEIREMCLFSQHDLLRDPPFSRLDLVSCRNLLIYFEPELQDRLIGMFHYALRPGGHLFLGPSESITTRSHLFASRDKRSRIFVREEAANSASGNLARMPDQTQRSRPPPAIADDNGIDRRVARAVTRYTPAFLVVDPNQDVVRFSGQTSKYLEPATGVASLHLFTLLHADLRPTVRSALKEAAARDERVVHRNLTIAVGDRNEGLNLIVEPLAKADGASLFLIMFQEIGTAGLGDGAADAAPAPTEGPESVLKQELQAIQERLRSVSEELEAANEELQSSNEEYLSVNEELQSTNEELETSKEELQSLNEELQTINAELNNRNESLVRSHSDLANLLDSTSIATLFLYNDLRIRRFTPRLLDIFNVREGDEGRPIGDIVTRLAPDGLDQAVKQVLATLIPLEREVTLAETGVSYQMQIRPYRDLNNVIDGAVVTFVDISDRKQHEQARALLATIVASSQDAILSSDLTGTITSWNAGAERLYGYTAGEAVGQPLHGLLTELKPDEWQDMLRRLEAGERIAHSDRNGIAKNGQVLEVSVTVSPIKHSDGHVVGASVVTRDIGDRKAAEQKTALLLSELDHRVKNILSLVSAVISQTLQESSAEDFTVAVEGRIAAIAKAHNLLTQSGRGEVMLRSLVAMELAPYDRQGGSNDIDGEDVALTPKAGMALAMAIHELTSNAAKYGALSNNSGRVLIAWAITGDAQRTLTLSWRERDGPPVTVPKRRGFGSELIEQALTYELDAEVTREFLPSGLQCVIAIPWTDEVGLVRARASEPAK